MAMKMLMKFLLNNIPSDNLLNFIKKTMVMMITPNVGDGLSYRYHTDDYVHRRTYLMAHIGEKRAWGHGCSQRFFFSFALRSIISRAKPIIPPVTPFLKS